MYVCFTKPMDDSNMFAFACASPASPYRRENAAVSKKNWNHRCTQMHTDDSEFERIASDLEAIAST